MADENVRIIQPGGGAAPGDFGISLDELKQMMELRKSEAITNLQNIGGIDKLCQKLRTSPTEGIIFILYVT